MKTFVIVFFCMISIGSFALAPVNFGTLNIAYTVNGVEITWSTLNESNNNYFVIERSTDSVNFINVGNLSGVGNSGSTQNYQFTDANVIEGTEYCYRIKQYDMDGSFSYSSQTCFIALGTNEVEQISPDQINAFPNPVQDIWNLTWDHSISFHTLKIYDLSGKEVYNISVAGKDPLKIDLSGFIQGNYIYRLEGDNCKYEGKLIKE